LHFPLPIEAQFAPFYASLAGDFDGDGKIDLVTGGNFSGVTPLEGRYDASYGSLSLHGDGRGGFTAVDMEQSGWRSMDRCGTWAFLKAGQRRSVDCCGAEQRPAAARADTSLH